MTDIALILLGASVARQRWWLLGAAGVAWFLLGAFFFVNAFTEEQRISPIYFTVPLLIDGVISFASAFGKAGAGRSVRFAKAAVFIAVALLVIVTAGHSEIFVGLTVGTFLVVDAGWRAVSAYVVRFDGWRRSIGYSVVEFLLGVWSFLPWPSHWQGEVGSDVGTLLMVSAFNVCVRAWRLSRLPEGAPVSRLAAAAWLKAPPEQRAASAAEGAAEAPRITATVHVWTPTGGLARVDHGISRYVAALDEKGVISTGHAALAANDLYVSHYPAVEIDRSGMDFRRALRATHDNDVPGHFQPSYAEESADWCPSTMQVAMPGIDEAALRRFWAIYSADQTYNLTSRNCSSTVATALEAGLEGVFARHAGSPYFLMRLFLSPELWIAAELRARAAAMAWTPGIVLDYARALSYIVSLPRRLGREDAAARPPAA